MGYFTNAQQAKEFLATRIIQESELEGMPLSEVEQKMLYFTETGCTLPDMPEISDRFDRDYDQDEYEEKIAKLVKSAANRAKKTSKDEYKQWWAAVRFLNKEDHYISLLIDEAHLKPPGDRPEALGHRPCNRWLPCRVCDYIGEIQHRSEPISFKSRFSEDFLGHGRMPCRSLRSCSGTLRRTCRRLAYRVDL